MELELVLGLFEVFTRTWLLITSLVVCGGLDVVCRLGVLLLVFGSTGFVLGRFLLLFFVIHTPASGSGSCFQFANLAPAKHLRIGEYSKSSVGSV